MYCTVIEYEMKICNTRHSTCLQHVLTGTLTRKGRANDAEIVAPTCGFYKAYTCIAAPRTEV